MPAETTSEQSGYFSIVEGKDRHLYVGTAKYRVNAYLVDFDPATKTMKVVVDAQKEIGTTATGFAAQSKIHTRNNVGASGRIYFGTKQGYPKEGEKATDYPGGYPMVYDPATGRTRVYPIPVPHQGIISVTPDESRGVAYISTCSDAPAGRERAIFLILDLATGQVPRPDGHATHVTRSSSSITSDGRITRSSAATSRGTTLGPAPSTRLKQTIDGRPPTADSLLAHSREPPDQLGGLARPQDALRGRDERQPALRL